MSEPLPISDRALEVIIRVGAPPRIFNTGRDPEDVQWRWLVWWLLYHGHAMRWWPLPMSWPEVAQHTGARNHSTPLTAKKRFEAGLKAGTLPGYIVAALTRVGIPDQSVADGAVPIPGSAEIGTAAA